MELSDNGLRFLFAEEGFRSCPYRDVTGTWTRGIGETEGIGPNSRCITEREGFVRARRIFNTHYAPALRGMKLNQNQYDAMGSFIWNCGPGAADWDVGRSIRAGRYQQAADELLQYVTSKGIVLADLQRRRARERALFLTPVKLKNPLDVLYPSERRAVNSYLAYIRHPKLHSHGLKVTKQKMIKMRKNIYDAAAFGRLENGTRVKEGWNINNRKARYDILKKYTL